MTRCLGHQYLYMSIGAGLVRGEYGMRFMLHAVIPCLVRMHSLDCTTYMAFVLLFSLDLFFLSPVTVRIQRFDLSL